MPRPSRHWLVWLDQAGWRQVHARHPLPAVAHWQEHGWPLVTRRAEASATNATSPANATNATNATDDELCCGIALPPDANGDKLRIAVRVPMQHVTQIRAPLLLDDIMADHLAALPPVWHQALLRLQRCGLPLRVFGSLSWQAITGLAYLRDSSDIDLLWQPQDATDLARGIALLEQHARDLPLDGELLFAGGDAVAWKEWSQVSRTGDGSTRILVKGEDGVRLARLDSMHCEAQPCAA